MKAYCINLKERPDKWKLAEREFIREGIDVFRMDGIRIKGAQHSKELAHRGCIYSHAIALRLLRDYKQFAIFEDDVLFVNGGWKKTMEVMQELPVDWDMFYLGATLTRPLERHSENIYRLKGGLTTHAIIYNNQHDIVDFILDKANNAEKIDLLISRAQELFNAYVISPFTCIQRAGKSDILNRYTDYAIIKDNEKKYML